MNKLFVLVALVLVLGFGSVASASTSTSTPSQSQFQRCVEVSHVDYPSGWYCPSEQARQRTMDLLIARIQALLVQLKALSL
jgi:hypothetical protein